MHTGAADTMTDNDIKGDGMHRRRQHLIKKKFQLGFSLKFFLLIIAEAIILSFVFWYLAHNTLITGYQGSSLKIENTSHFFYPDIIYAVIAVVAVTGLVGLAGFIFISHKIAGPLYRFEESLKEVGRGNLAHRFSLRKGDQLSQLADALNDMTSTVEAGLSGIQENVREIKKEAELLQQGSDRDEAAERHINSLVHKAHELEKLAGFFSTSIEKGASSAFRTGNGE